MFFFDNILENTLILLPKINYNFLKIKKEKAL